MIRLALVFALSGMSALTSASSARWPDLVAPPRSDAQWVADDMKQNNVPMRIKRFTSAMSVNEVIDFYRDQWREGGKIKTVENDLQDWKIIGRGFGDFYVTVQAKPAAKGGSEGFIAATMLLAASTVPGVDQKFPRMPGTQVMSDSMSNDLGKIGKTLVLKNSHSVQSNVSHYQSVMPTQGWIQNTFHVGSPDGGKTYVLFFERPRETAHVVISSEPRGGAMIVVNVVMTSI